MIIILATIGAYYINGYCGYFFIKYWWLLMVIILATIGGYYINGYCGFFLLNIGGYYINNYWCLLY